MQNRVFKLVLIILFLIFTSLNITAFSGSGGTLTLDFGHISDISKTGRGGSIDANFVSGDTGFGLWSGAAITADVGVYFEATSPTVTITNPPNGFSTTATSVTLNYTGSDVENNISKYTVQLDNGTQIDNGLNLSYTFTGLSVGSHTLKVFATDSTDLNSSTASIAITITTKSNGTVSSGGSSAVIKEGEIAKRLTIIRAGHSVTVKYDDPAIPIISIKLFAETLSINPLITLKYQIDSIEGATKPIPLYKYFEILLTETNEKPVKIIINFRVPKEWLKENGFEKDEIILLRLVDNKLEKQETNFMKEDETNYFYKATTEGVSFFAISAKKKIVEPSEPVKETVVEIKTKVLSVEQKIVPLRSEIIIGLIILGLSAEEEIVDQTVQLNKLIETRRSTSVIRIDLNGSISFNTEIRLIVKNTSETDIKNMKITEFIPTEMTRNLNLIQTNHKINKLVTEKAIQFELQELKAGEETRYIYWIEEEVTDKTLKEMQPPLITGEIIERGVSIIEEPTLPQTEIPLELLGAITALVIVVFIGYFFWKREKGKTELEKSLRKIQ